MAHTYTEAWLVDQVRHLQGRLVELEGAIGQITILATTYRVIAHSGSPYGVVAATVPTISLDTSSPGKYWSNLGTGINGWVAAN